MIELSQSIFSVQTELRTYLGIAERGISIWVPCRIAFGSILSAGECHFANRTAFFVHREEWLKYCGK
jgi:hypothetical protein